MIKKVSKIKTISDVYPINVDVLKLDPPLGEVEYLTGGFYKTSGYSMFAFYESDENGKILNENPVIHDEGLNTYVEIFEQAGYVYI